MKNAWLIICLIALVVSTAIGQTNILPKTGEGRYNRSKKTVFWPNTMFTHPSIFVSKGDMDLRPTRKWWRTPIQAVASVAHPALYPQKEEPVLAEYLLSLKIEKPSPLPALELEPFLPLPAFQLIQLKPCPLKKQILDYMEKPDNDRPLIKPEVEYEILFP